MNGTNMQETSIRDKYKRQMQEIKTVNRNIEEEWLN